MPLDVSPTPFVIRPPADLAQRHPQITSAARQIALRYAHRELVTDEMLRAIGSALWQALEIDADFETARQAAGLRILPLVVSSDDPAVQQLPWETLHHPELGFLGRHQGFTLSRTLGEPPAALPETRSGPLRVLLFTSLPDDLDPEHARLDVEEEQAQVQEALAPWVAEGVIDLRMPDDGRLATFQAELRGYRPHLVFLSGHGSFRQPPLDDEPPYGSFLFEGEDGGSEPVREAALAAAFVGAPVECLVLSACESGKAASDALASGLARHLAARGLPQVIGMRESILDRAGIRFARALCDAIADRNRVDSALQMARAAITRPLEGAVWRDGEGAALEELSLGQWCLPMLLSRDPARPLVDWAFTPQPPQVEPENATLENVTLPPRFLGRRAELRTLRGDLEAGRRRRLLITGPGGQGKTALAGRLALGLRGRGYRLLVWSARPGVDWSDFRLELELMLSQENTRRYDAKSARCADEACRAALLLKLLLQQSGGRLLLFLDNLESIQDPDDLTLQEGPARAWIAAAGALAEKGLVLLLTSRWRLPDWPEDGHWTLEHANYGDFLQFARTRRLPVAFFRERDRLRRVHRALHGNFRGLEFFAAALQDMDRAEGDAFLAALAEAEAQTQTDMALAQVVAHRGEAERELLRRLPAHPTPVPLEGVVRLALDLEAPERLLDALLAVSLVERNWAPDLRAWEYQCPALVAAWLEANGARPPTPGELAAAAGYQLYLLRNERQTLPQAMAAHQALARAGRQAEADRLTLDWIVGPLNRRGLYRTLLDTWLPPVCESADRKTRAEALGQTGKQHHHLGNYAAALPCFEQSLSIQQEIGDKSGEGATLNNISQIFKARGDYDTALQYLKQSLSITQEIGDKSGEGTTLNNISQIYDARGDYDTALQYLKQSLSIGQEIGDKSGEGATLNNMATTAHARGDYDTALQYLKQSLSIQQEIGDTAGLCATLFNMGHIHLQNEEVPEALGAWVSVYRMAKPMGLAQALAALEELAGQLGIPGGLDGWEALAQRMGGEGGA